MIVPQQPAPPKQDHTPQNQEDVHDSEIVEAAQDAEVLQEVEDIEIRLEIQKIAEEIMEAERQDREQEEKMKNPEHKPAASFPPVSASKPQTSKGKTRGNHSTLGDETLAHKAQIHHPASTQSENTPKSADEQPTGPSPDSDLIHPTPQPRENRIQEAIPEGAAATISKLREIRAKVSTKIPAKQTCERGESGKAKTGRRELPTNAQDEPQEISSDDEPDSDDTTISQQDPADRWEKAKKKGSKIKKRQWKGPQDLQRGKENKEQKKSKRRPAVRDTTRHSNHQTEEKGANTGQQ